MDIGKRIKRLRQQSRMTQKEIADRCEFTVSLLSKIENGATVPPVATLSKIATVLGTNVSALLNEEDTPTGIMTKGSSLAKDKLISTDKGYLFHLFAAEQHDKKMQPYLFVADKGKVKKESLSHAGEEFVYVLEGSMKYRVGSVEYLLEAGDSLYFDSTEEHELDPVSDTVKYLAVFAE